MPRSLTRFNRGSSRTQRRLTAWGLGPSTGGTPPSSQAISSSATTLATTGIVAVPEGLTLVRTRGLLTLQLTTANVAGAGFDGAFGIAITDTEAFLAGAASVPDPQDDPDAEVWIYHTWFTVASTQFTATEEIGADNLASLRMIVDSKAMRKFPVGKTMYAVLGTVENGVSTMNWTFGARVLFKLP